MINSTALAKAIEKYRDKKFFLGDPSKGWDCLNSLMDLYRGFGYRFPEEMEGIDESNYARTWEEDNDFARLVFEKFLFSLGDPVDFNYFIRGDLLVFKGDKFPCFPAVALGNGNMMMVFREGVRIESFSRFKKYLIAVRRLA